MRLDRILEAKEIQARRNSRGISGLHPQSAGHSQLFRKSITEHRIIEMLVRSVELLKKRLIDRHFDDHYPEPVVFPQPNLERV